MSKIYEITGNYEMLFTMLYDEETDTQMILDTMESIEGEFDDKADNYAKIITEILGDAEKIKKQEDRLSARRKALENRAKLLKENLYKAMKQIGKPSFKTNLFSFNIQKKRRGFTVNNRGRCARRIYKNSN